MVSRELFARYVQQVLLRLHDRAYLETHPLARLLVEPTVTGGGESLRSAVVDAIEQFRPADSVTQDSSSWRIYRQLCLRHLDGYGLKDVSRELLISKRQAERDHAKALEAIVAMLWARHCDEQKRREAARATADKAGLEPEGEGSSKGDDELIRLGSSMPKGPTDLRQTLQESLATGGRLIESRRASFEVALSDRLPTVAVNRLALRQSILNLLTYISEVGANSLIALRAEEAPPNLEVRLTIRRGRSGAEAEASHPMPSLEARAALAVSRRLIEMQGGSLLVPTSDCVLLRLPVAKLPLILVIDDNPDLGRLFRRYLRSRPYRVMQATNGPSALDLARRLRPDIITLDVLMPMEDGWEILRALKASPDTSQTPVLVCSVLPERSLALSLGVVDFLSKPVMEHQLVTALERWLPAS